MKDLSFDPRKEKKNVYVQETEENFINFYKPLKEWTDKAKALELKALGENVIIKRLPPKLGKGFAFGANMDPYSVANIGTHKGVVISIGSKAKELFPELKVGSLIGYENYAAKVIVTTEPADIKDYQDGIDGEWGLIHSMNIALTLGKYKVEEWEDSNGYIFTTPAAQSKNNPNKMK